MAAKKKTSKNTAPKRSSAPAKTRAPRKPKITDPDKMEVVDQIVHIFMKSGKGKSAKSKHLAAALLGAVLGGFVPIASFIIAHVMMEGVRLATMHAHFTTYLVLGGLLYSAPTVYAWSKKAFGGDNFVGKIKPLGFVLLLEGVMITSSDKIAVQAVSFAALGILVFINAVASGCKLALKRTAALE